MLSYYRLLDLYFINCMYRLLGRVLPDFFILYSMSDRMYQLYFWNFLWRMRFRVQSCFWPLRLSDRPVFEWSNLFPMRRSSSPMPNMLIVKRLHSVFHWVFCQFKHLSSLYDSHRMLNVYLINFMYRLFDRVLPKLRILHCMSSWLYQLYFRNFLWRMRFWI